MQFEELYHQIAVDAGAAGRFTVNVWRYRNKSLSSPAHETKTAWDKALMPLLRTLRKASRVDQGLETQPDWTRLAIRRPADDPRRRIYADGDYEYFDTESIHRTYVGKGSPTDIELTLRLAVRYKSVAATR